MKAWSGERQGTQESTEKNRRRREGGREVEKEGGEVDLRP